jgi:precorrin-8X/cobalt-precorrin-8 methylmutase
VKPLFDAYLMVDWSAANGPCTGRDSIWIALAEREAARGGLRLLENIPTRSAAMERIAGLIATLLDDGKRLLAGFDFGFGYPAGAARSIGGAADWRAVWSRLARDVADGRDNRSNRFALAGQMNVADFAAPLFWGHANGQRHEGLSPTKTARYVEIAERRLVEHRVRSTKSVWQMAYTGSVGSQTLLGIAALERLRTRPDLKDVTAVWPFETEFAACLERAVTIAEIYPSLFSIAPFAGEVKDAAQVRTVATALAALDREGRLEPLLAAPDDLDETQRAVVLGEEGWIVGAGLVPDALRPMPRFNFVRDPAAIYDQSFATIEAEADLSRFPNGMRSVAVRLIHACGMVDLVGDIVFSSDAASAGRSALGAGAPILCDVEMVRRGVIGRLLPAQNDVLCLLNDARVPARAEEDRTTRSAAQVDFWVPHMENAVVAIGNAPTALFRLLELIDAGAPKPALIIGMPVGFVGAAESKAELMADSRGVPFITVKGRRGGNAIAAGRA